MADSQIKDITAATAIVGTDLLLLQRDPSGSPVDRKAPATFLLNRGLAIVTGADAATTCAANSLYIVDMSAWATADRIYTMPASPSIGDRVSFLIQGGNASYELIIKGNTSQTINGGSGASEWSRLFITGEGATLVYVASNVWLVEFDMRKRMQALLRLSTSTNTTESAGTWYYPTDRAGAWTADVNVGGIANTTNGRITARRACNASVGVGGYPATSLADGNAIVIALEPNGDSTSLLYDNRFAAAAGPIAVSAGKTCIPAALDDYFRLRYQTTVGSKGLLNLAVTFVSFAEILV